jgi:hypothetical protein
MAKELRDQLANLLEELANLLEEPAAPAEEPAAPAEEPAAPAEEPAAPAEEPGDHLSSYDIEEFGRLFHSFVPFGTGDFAEDQLSKPLTTLSNLELARILATEERGLAGQVR